MSKERPKDIIDAMQEIAAKNGSFQPVDEAYYESFLDLTAADFERLTIVMMLNHEKEIRRLSGGRTDADAIEAVAQFIARVLHIMSMGLGTLDGVANFGITARVGPEPSPEMAERLNKSRVEARPVIKDVVERFLPWLLTKEGKQGRHSI